MADEVTIKVDGGRAIAKLGRVPLEVRNQLRMVIPGLTREIGAAVNAKLDSQLKSRTHIAVRQEMHDTTAGAIYGLVKAEWTGAAAQKLVPLYLEVGTRAHEIVPRNASALSFFWEKTGMQMILKKVQHPGTQAIYYMRNTFAEMKDQIVSALTSAAKKGASDA